MMVTFISQCEKKALNRTRRVLDAFANRIGSNVWQTVITQEGLLAVKKLLGKTASKNTAVSCHWIRSRSRSELVWVIGRRDTFDTLGRVPVNRTEKEVPMDIYRDKPIKGVNYANTQLQQLDQHLFAVGFVAEQLYLKHYCGENKKNNAKVAFIAGCFHDVGKIDPCFQSWVVKDKNKAFEAQDGNHIDEAKFSFEKHPRHNEISALTCYLLDDVSLKWLNNENKDAALHAIYWHHAKPFRTKGGFETYGDIYKKLDKNTSNDAWNITTEKATSLLNRVCAIDSDYRETGSSDLANCYQKEVDRDKLRNVELVTVPVYKEYEASDSLESYPKNVRINSANNEIRACVISADRWVSSMSAKELASAIKHKKINDFINAKLEEQLNTESNLLSHIDDCLTSFPNSERTKQQADVAKKLADNVENIAVLAGAAGCGKTKIALEWAKLRNAQQIFWICPRVQICQGLFNELSASDSPYLQDASIEIHTGEFKCQNNYSNVTPESEYFTGDIVITTIDQILGTVISHSKADRLLNFLRAHVVFDEFHEYINMPAFNLLFSELVESKKSLASGCNTLLVSATPNYFYLENMLDLYIDDQYGDVVEMPSFNTCQYQFNFVQYDETQQDETNPLYKIQPINTFVISNTAQTAQQSFIKNQNQENSILLHSKFKKSDKQSLFEKTFDSFKRDGSKEFELLRSGPIVQASLNISCDHMVSEITNAENCLQRLGRLDRFGENKDTVNKYTIVIPETLHNGKGTGALARFLSSRHYSLASTKAWYEFLTNTHSMEGKALTLADVYKLYKTFYTEGYATEAMESDLLTAMKASVTVILSKVTEPQTHAPKKKKEQKRTKISNNSLRGNSRFVQMAICDVSNSAKPQIQDEYAYAIPVHENDPVDNLTMSLDMIRDKGLIDYAAQKHARIDETSIIKGIPANQINIRKTLLESYAKDPEHPIYLSYTPSELSQKLGETSAHEEAIYYAICEKQAVGTMSIKQLTN